MYKKQFEEVLHSIDKEKLEKSLQIEGLKKIEIIEFNERLYSYVSKCKVLNSSNPKYIYVKIQKIDRERSEIFVKFWMILKHLVIGLMLLKIQKNLMWSNL